MGSAALKHMEKQAHIASATTDGAAWWEWFVLGVALTIEVERRDDAPGAHPEGRLSRDGRPEHLGLAEDALWQRAHIFGKRRGERELAVQPAGSRLDCL